MLNLNLQEVLTLRQTIRNDPVFFVERVLGNTLWQKEKDILLSVRDHATTAVRSCHASGKTFTAARAVNWWLTAYDNSIVITTAPTFRQVKEILWREIRSSVLGRGLYPKDAVLDTQINISDQWFALGLSTDRPDQFQGFHAPHLLVVVDEASGVTSEIYEAIDGLVPKRILLIGNPLENSGRFADSFKDAKTSKIAISAFDTPNLKGGQYIPGLITSEYVEKMKAYYGEDSDVYRVRVLGEFPLQDTESLIGVDEVAKAMEREATVLAHWEKRMGVDPARFGDDRTAIVVRQMEKVIRKEVFSSLDTMAITGKVLTIAKEERIKDHNISIDEIGVGAGVVDRLREQGWRINGVNVAVKAQDEEHYANLRAELYAGKLKEWIKTADLPKDDDFYELANIKYQFTSTGQLQLEKKEDMKKRGLVSPDVADALMLTFAHQGIVMTMQATEPVKPYYPDLNI